MCCIWAHMGVSRESVCRVCCTHSLWVYSPCVSLRGVSGVTQRHIRGMSQYTHGAAQRGDQTSNIWISRSTRFSGRSFEWRGLRLLTWKPVWNFGDSRENMFDVYGDSRENLLEILAVVIIWSPISSVRGPSLVKNAFKVTQVSHVTHAHTQLMSRHTCLGHVIYDWVMSHMQSMSHTWVVSHTHTHTRLMSRHTSLKSRLTSRHTCLRSHHLWLSHVTHAVKVTHVSHVAHTHTHTDVTSHMPEITSPMTRHLPACSHESCHTHTPTHTTGVTSHAPEVTSPMTESWHTWLHAVWRVIRHFKL